MFKKETNRERKEFYFAFNFKDRQQQQEKTTCGLGK